MTTTSDTEQLRKCLRAQLRKLGGAGPLCVSLNRNGQVKYDESIARGRGTDMNPNPEEFARALLVLHVVYDLEYPAERISLEHQVAARAGRSKSGPKWVDIALESESGEVWALIEAKSPGQFDVERDNAWEGQLFGLSRFLTPQPQCLALATWDIDANTARLEVANTQEYDQYSDWHSEGEPTTTSIPSGYGKPCQPVFVNGGTGEFEAQLREDVSSQELVRLQDQIHTILWGGGLQRTAIYFTY